MLKIVVHSKNGEILKGSTNDFSPVRPSFHLRTTGDNPSVMDINLSDLKAVFFVKDFDGNPDHVYLSDFNQFKGFGKQLIITFKDGEKLHGVADAINRTRTGFFVSPIDKEANTIRAFVINDFIENVEMP